MNIMLFLVLWNESLKDMYWLNKCRSEGKSCGDPPGLVGIPEKAIRHASIDEKPRNLIMYVPPRQRIIPPRQKSHRSRSLETLCA